MNHLFEILKVCSFVGLNTLFYHHTIQASDLNTQKQIEFQNSYKKTVEDLNHETSSTKSFDSIPSCDLSVQTFLEEGIAHFIVRGKKFGAIDKMGKWILPCEFDFTVDEFSCTTNWDYDSYIDKESKLVLAKNKKYGIWNTNGENIVPAKYLTIETTECYRPDYYFLVQKAEIEIQDSKFNSVRKIEIDSYIGNSYSALFFIKNKHVFSIDKYTLEQTELVDQNNFCVEFQGKYGLVSSKGKIVYGFKSDNYISDNQLVYKSRLSVDKTVENRVGLIDEKGKLVLNFDYVDIGRFGVKSSLFEVMTTDFKLGLVHGNGKILVPFIYDDIDLEYAGLRKKSNYLVKLYKNSDDKEFKIVLSNNTFLLNEEAFSKVFLFDDLFIVYKLENIYVFDYDGNWLVIGSIEDFKFNSLIENQLNFQYYKEGSWKSLN